MADEQTTDLSLVRYSFQDGLVEMLDDLQKPEMTSIPKADGWK